MKTLLFFAIGIYAAFLLDRLILFILEPDYVYPETPCDGLKDFPVPAVFERWIAKKGLR